MFIAEYNTTGMLQCRILACSSNWTRDNMREL